MKIFNRIVFVCNLIALVALAGSYLARFISPALTWHIAFLGLAFPFIIMVNFAFVIYWALQFDTRIWYSLLALLIGYSYIYRFIQFNAKKTDDRTHALSVVSFNTHSFGVFENKNDYDSSVFFNRLRGLKPDIMCFQEFVTYYTERDTRMYRQIFSEYKTYYKYNVDNNDVRPTGYSISIFSKYPIVKGGVVERLNQGGNCTIFSDIVFNDDTIRVITTHLKSIAFAPDDFETVEELKENDNEKDVDVKSIKGIASKLKRAFIMRAKQVEVIKDFIEKTPYKIILTGDFNDSPSSYAYNMLRGEMKDAFVESGSGISATYVGKMPSFRIDYILCDKSFEVYNYKPYRLNFSDHKMLSATIKVK